jgi:predicted ATPase
MMSVHGWAAAEVGEVVERAAEVGRRLESSQELAPSIANLWVFHYACGRLDAAEKISDDLFRIARELNSSEVLLQAHHCAWPVRWGRGGLIDAVEHIDAGLALYDEERHAHHRFHYLGHDPAVCGLSIASLLHAILGNPARARDAGDRALALARRLNHDPSLVHGLWFVVESQIVCHDVAGVIANTTELLRLAAQHGLPFPHAIGRVYRGWALVSTGKHIEGMALALEGVAQLERLGGRMFLSRTYCLVAEAHLIVGQYAEGLEQVNKAIHVASEIGDAFYPARLFQTRARLLQAFGQADDAAEADWRRSLELAQAQGAKLFELRAAIGLVRLWRCQGKRDDAGGLLASICDRFTEGIETPEFKEAKTLLDAVRS